MYNVYYRCSNMENLIKYVNWKNKQLLKEDFNFEYLFNVIHDQGNRIFGEYLSNFQIKEVTYKEMKSYSLKMASFLKNNIHDDCSYVGLYLDNSINSVACFWGVLLSGHNVCLLNTKLPIEVNKNVIKALGIKTVVLDNDVFNGEYNIIHIKQTNDYIDDVLSCSEIDNIVSGNEIAITTTATSLNYKICIYNVYDIMYQVRNAKAIIKANRMVKAHYNGRLKVLAFLPFYHIFGLFAAYFWFSIFGRTFVFLKDYSPDTILNTIKRHNVTHVFAVPILWNTIAKEIKKGIDELDEAKKNKAYKWINRSIKIQNIMPSLGRKLARKIYKEIIDKTLGDSIKFLISGGGEVASDTLKIINGIGYPLFNGYGASEIGITSVELRKKAGARILGSVGKPFKSIEYKIMDGMLYVKGLSTCSKIIEKNGNTIIVNKEEWFKTCDEVRIIKGYYYIDGRSDDVYISSTGEKYNPDVMEAICLLTKVDNYCIIKMDKYLSLIIQIKDNLSLNAREAIKDEIDKAVKMIRDKGYPLHKIYYTFDLIANPNAIKVSRAYLTSKINNGLVTLYPFDTILEKDNDLELVSSYIKEVTKVFSEILGINELDINPHQHFIYDLGGSSLDYLSLLVKLKSIYNIDFNEVGLTLSTVAEFAKFIMNKL